MIRFSGRYVYMLVDTTWSVYMIYNIPSCSSIPVQLVHLVCLPRALPRVPRPPLPVAFATPVAFSALFLALLGSQISQSHFPAGAADNPAHPR